MRAHTCRCLLLAAALHRSAGPQRSRTSSSQHAAPTAVCGPARPPSCLCLCSAADAEQLAGQVNPGAFQRAAAADEDGLEELREQAGLLKKVCRQKAVYCLKDVRRQMEDSRGARLHRNLEALQADLAAVEATREQVEGVAAAAQQFVAEQHRRMAEADATRREEVERRAGVVGMRARIQEEGAANEARRGALAEAQARVAKLRVSLGGCWE